MSKVIFIIQLFFFSVIASSAVADNHLPEIDKKKVDQRPELAAQRNDVEKSKSIIKEIKTQVPFTNLEKEKVWRLKDFDKDSLELNNDPDLYWLREIMSFISLIIEAALWLGVVVIVFLLYRYRDYWLSLIQGKKPQINTSNLPETLFGLDLREQSLPDNIEQSAQNLWQSEDYREAISLLYRGALAYLFKEYEFDLPAGATEHDCLRYIAYCSRQNKTPKTLTEHQLQLFKSLTDVWVEVAYAHMPPQKSVFQALCNDWNQCFLKQPEIK